MIKYAVGISLGASSSIESGVAVLEIATNQLIYVDKMFSLQDIQLFFDNFKSLKESLICVSLPWDNSLLEGKWRILSKPYQLLNTKEESFRNKDNWLQRFSMRGCDFLNSLMNQGYNIFRYEIYLTRQKMNLISNFKERSTADCKFLQSALRYEYGFTGLPTNMMPVAQLEAIVGALLIKESLNNNLVKIFTFKNLDVVNLK